jgi:subtilisin family serine protease
MAEYVLVNRRSGMFTESEKVSSRAMVSQALGMLPNARIVADIDPIDPLARRVSLVDVNPMEVEAVRANLPPDAILEPAIRRQLHRRVPIELRPTVPTFTTAVASSSKYRLTVTAGGAALGHIDVMVYFRHSSGTISNTTVQTNAKGKFTVTIPPGSDVAFVEPIPYANFWIMLADAPPSGGTIDCLPIPKPKPGGRAWWHERMNIDHANPTRGAGIKVGVIDTGCGPHRNLGHVTLVGAFVDGTRLPPGATADVAEHGTHTSGIIGARPTKASDYAGLAPGCDLFHARVFKSEERGDGPTQADIINAIDALSREHGCDLINMSLGGGPPSQAEEDAIRDAAERGTVCICSAGNDNGPIEFPGAYPECAAVSAIGLVGWAPAGTFSANNRPHEAAKMGADNLFLASFSCFGATLACAAPGVGIVSTVPPRAGHAGDYMEMDGTSMASPAACGALAVILAEDAQYKALPRDRSRSKRAALVLAQHCKAFGLPVKFEGRGLPTV